MLDVREVQSSVVERVGYDSGNRQLYIEFKRNGAVWRYLDVPAKIHLELVGSDSVGKGIAAIKKNFPGEKVEDAEWSRLMELARGLSQEEIAERLNAANGSWLSRLKAADRAIGF